MKAAESEFSREYYDVSIQSTRSQHVLGGAAIWTTDAAAIRRAREFSDRFCTGPLRPKYREGCKRLYTPPRFSGQRANGKYRQQRVMHTKLWIVKLREYSIPESEVQRHKQREVRAAKLVKDESRSKADGFHWPYETEIAGELRPGDWFIQVNPSSAL